MRKMPDTSKLKDILQNIGLVVFKTVKVIKNKGILRKLLQPTGAEGDRMIKHNGVPWTGSWETRRTLGKNQENMSKV